MQLTIPVAHDFICPWCWVGFLQSQKLTEEFGVKFDWLGYELFPVELDWGYASPTPEPPANKPPILSRFEFILAADDMEMPSSQRPKQMRTFNAHEAVEYAKTEGLSEQLIAALYHAYWERGEEINDPEVIQRLATGIVTDLDALRAAVAEQRFKHNILGFDDAAYASGVYNVPTFFIGDKRYAEQPYIYLRRAVAAALD